jgi:ankyrin repeat protein
MLHVDPPAKQRAMVESSQLTLLILNEMEQYLRRRGADINARDDSGNTALAVATGNGHSNVMNCLRDRGAA